MKKKASLYIMAIVMAFFMVCPAYAGTAPADVTAGEEPDCVIMFASDYQSRNTSANTNLARAMEAAYNAGYQFDNVIFCGDYTTKSGTANYGGNTDKNIKAVRNTVAAVDPSIPSEDMIFVQGNHDKLTGSISTEGLHYFDDYIVYVLNTQRGNPWKQGYSRKESTVKSGASKLDKALAGLAAKGETRPVFIATHVPLHFSSRTASTTGDNLYSKHIYNAIKKYADKLSITFVFGHNHSSNYDNYLGGGIVYRPTSSNIMIPRVTSSSAKRTTKYNVCSLNFTYMNAGYVGDRKSVV